MPEGAYDDTAFADLHYGQNYEDAAALYDCVLPMAYSKAYEKDSPWVRSVAEGTIKRGLKTIMGLHAYDTGTGITLSQDIAALQDAPIDGVCLFRFGAFAMAFWDSSVLRLVNTLSQPITDITPFPGSRTITLSPPILPGEDRAVPLPALPDSIRVFSGKGEVCACLFHHQT